MMAMVLGEPPSAWGQSSYQTKSAADGKIMPGNVAFVDTLGKRVVELDRTGRVVWSWRIPASVVGKGDIRAGADLEWIAADDSFLVTIPFRGIFRVSRAGKVIWQHLTAKVSHDADLLPNRNILYVNGWDKPSDAQVTEIDPKGNLVWSWRAKGVVDEAWRKPVKGEQRDSYGHTNAAVRLLNGDTVVSLRNFNRLVLVGADGQIRYTWDPIQRVHEPTILPGGTLIASKHARQLHTVISVSPDGQRRTIFTNAIGIHPIRTVQVLDNGNFLLTGGEEIIEIDATGTIVWHAAIYAKSDQKRGQGARRGDQKNRSSNDGKRGQGGKRGGQQTRSSDTGERGVYKAVWVDRQG